MEAQVRNQPDSVQTRYVPAVRDDMPVVAAEMLICSTELVMISLAHAQMLLYILRPPQMAPLSLLSATEMV